MAWHFRAQRAVTGEWLHTDVPLDGEVTYALSRHGRLTGFIPLALDVEYAHDGAPMWLERSTVLVADPQDGSGELWVGLCTYSAVSGGGRRLEFEGLASGFDRMAFLGEIRQWQPDPYAVIEKIVTDAQGQPDGNLGFKVVYPEPAPGYPGDERPPTRPAKPKRRKGESREAYDDRLFEWEKKVDDWERDFGDREPYHIAYWEGVYVGEELSELAEEVGFDWYERHVWANKAQLTRRSELVLQTRREHRIHDQALIEGVNMVDVIDPRTSLDGYANHVIGLGAGEGRAMRTASVAKRDLRIRTTAFLDAKNVSNKSRLIALTARARRRAVATVTLSQAQARDLGPITLGHELEVRSRVFTGWCRVTELTRSTTTGTIGLTFEQADRSLR